jgi:hypothetical protein
VRASVLKYCISKSFESQRETKIAGEGKIPDGAEGFIIFESLYF